MGKKYITIQLPEDMIKLIDELLEEGIGSAVREFAKNKIIQKEHITKDESENEVIIKVPNESELVRLKDGEWDVIKIKRIMTKDGKKATRYEFGKANDND